MAQGIMALHPSNILTSALKRPAKVQLHKILQGTGATLALTGIVLQYLNKNWYLKIDHLGTPHSVFGRNKNDFKFHFISNPRIFLGAISATSLILSVTSGISLTYSSKFRNIVKPSSIRRFHNAVTVVAFSTGMLALIGGYMTKKFIIENDPAEMRKGLALSTAAILLITAASPVRSLIRGKVV